MKKLFLAIVFLFYFLSGFGQSVLPPKLIFDANSETKELTVSDLAISYVIVDNDVFTVTHKNNIIKVTCKKNNSEKKINGIITIKGKSDSNDTILTVKVSQNIVKVNDSDSGNNVENEQEENRIQPDTIKFAYNDNTSKKITLKGNIDTTGIDDSWFSFSQENKMIFISCIKNIDTTGRNGVISVIDNEDIVVQKIYVIQESNPIATLEKNLLKRINSNKEEIAKNTGIKNEIKIIYIFLIALLLVFIIMFVFINYSNNKKYKELKKEIESIKNNFDKKEEFPKISEYVKKDELSKLIEKIIEFEGNPIEKKINSMFKFFNKNKEDKSKSDKNVFQKNDTENKVSFNHSTPSINHIYISAQPMPEGNLPNNITEDKSKAYFKLEKIKGTNKAKFWVAENSSFYRSAIQRMDTYLLPICELANAFNPNASEIKTTSPGELELDGKVWKCTKKAKIILI